MKNLAPHIDSTLLRVNASINEYEEFIIQNSNKGFYSLCLPPSMLTLATQLISPQDKLSTVIGFPCGFQPLKTKLFEIEQALQNGAHYIDTVINIPLLKSIEENSNNEELLKNELNEIRTLTMGHELRIIIEQCYLNEQETTKITELIMTTNCDVVKTSTGFAPEGATIQGVALLSQITKNIIKIKASGGIKTKEQALAFIEAGAQIIGTSSGLMMR